MRRTRSFLLVLLAMLLGSCGDDVRRIRLPNGATVEIDGDSLALRKGGRPLLVLDHGVRAERFHEDVTELWGFYDFQQTTDSTVEWAQIDSVTRDGGDVVVTFVEADGASSATLRIHGDASDATSAELTASPSAPIGAIIVPTRCDERSSYLGFGEQYNATDQRGEAFPLWVGEQGLGRQALFLANGDAHTTYFPMPYYMDARGFGVVLDTDARVTVDLCQTDPTVASFRVEDGAPLELTFLHGPTPKDVIRELGDRYGRPTAPEPWVYQPWIGVQGGQARVLQEADDLDAAQVPWSALWVQDWVGFLDLGGGFRDIQYHWNVDTTLYPDLPGLTATLHGRGKRFLGYANAFVEQSREHFAPMDAAGYLIRDAASDSLIFDSFKGHTSLPDLTNPDASAYVGTFLDAMITVQGMDGWMADFGEWLPIASMPFDGGQGRQEHNRHPRRWQQLNHSVARARLGNDYAIFTRSGWLGCQGTVQIVWIGDQEADFLPYDGLPTVIPAMLNLGLSGVPYVTHDIAGYSGGPSTEELYRRWTELGAFTPIMRTHEGLKSALNWRWNGGPDATAEQRAAQIAHFRRFARIHEALGPLFESLADEAAATSVPMLRHLLLEFPNDREVVGIDDEFMVGESLLVAPVITAGATSREVYLPAGTWIHALHEGESYRGPLRVTIDAPIGEPPVFWRGSEAIDLRSIE